ncbi:MAG: hypothetical protein U0452_09730 [Anaerolineae bacterium]
MAAWPRRVRAAHHNDVLVAVMGRFRQRRTVVDACASQPFYARRFQLLHRCAGGGQYSMGR